jgi:CheY-like chemotaxis protein
MPRGKPTLGPRHCRGMAEQPIPRVLIAEDEVLTALQVEDIVHGMGWVAVGPAAGIPELLALIDRIGCDVALLDVNLHGQRVYAVADRLRAAGIPFALITAYQTTMAASVRAKWFLAERNRLGAPTNRRQ